MKRVEIQRWERTREKGMLRFILLRGVLVWGVPVFFIVTFVIYKVSLSDVSRILMSAVVFFIWGLLLGGYIWVGYEKKYKRSIKGGL